MPRFSERIEITPPRVAIQVGSMDLALRNALWNVLIDTFLLSSDPNRPSNDPRRPYHKLWDEFFRLAVDELPWAEKDARAFIRDWYFEAAEWWQVYDLVQFAADCYSDEPPGANLSKLANALRVPGVALSPREAFTNKCNAALERDLAGYRFVGGVLIPMSDVAQTGAIAAALNASASAPFRSANSHLATSLRLFAERETPSYRNVIKEAVLAVEATAQVVAGKPGAALGDALKRIDDAIGVHSALNQGFQKIYGYTSDADGIRHALTDQESLQQEDAIFMLVSCSAFVSYLIAKSERARLVPLVTSGL